VDREEDMQPLNRFIIRSALIRVNALNAIRNLPYEPLHEVTIRKHKSTRTLEQNNKMWAMLTDISKQVVWHGLRLTPEEWKEMVTAALKRQKVVPGIDGGFVVIGASTSKMSIKEMIDVIDFAYAFGADPDHPVKWSEPEIPNYGGLK
jgi:hypothetical protein